ncbi:hypothetical protein DH2020_034430 [Rehmannia glutinosa]|uniref:YDG domain-containing protein n=1 Tax=Rehmannia glutinosa TaxID=99300 RepID=A0ABR0VCN4_REHGL
MTLLADSSSTPKKPWQRCLRSNFKHPKLDAVRRFPANCGAPPPTDIIRPESNAVANSPIDCPAIACCNSPSNIKRPKVDVARNSPEHCGPFAYGINGGESEFPVDGKKYAVAIPAVPLRSVPLINSENSVLSDAKDGDVGKIMAKENENKLRSQEESWRHDSEKLAEVIAEAKNYINGFDVRYSSSKQVLASEDYQPPSLEYAVLDKHNSIGEPKPLKQEKRAGEINLAESVTQQNLDESRSEKRMKVEYRVSKVVQEKKASGLVSKCEGNEEEVCVLSPEEWRTLPLCVRHKRNLTNCDSNATAMYSDISIKTDVNGNNEPKYDDDRKDLINLSIVQHEQPRRKVMEALKLFDDHYTELVKKSKAEPRGERKGTKYPHLEAAERLKDAGMYISIEKHFGHIPGIEIGDEFRFRTELALVGLHRQLIAGIDHVVLDGKKYATSIVDSGRYENEAKTLDVLIYSGQGWIKKNADNSVDQKPEKGNLALMNSMEMGYPVRVIFKRSLAASKVYTSNERNFVYVYDGLYTVNNFWQEKDRIGKLVFKFELHRMPGQPRPHQTDAKSRKSGECDEVCMVDDLSQGKEKMPIRAMNGVDDARPPPFTYVTDIVYPHWYQQIDPIGCNCKNGCSDSRKCPCVLKNGDEIPFNENGAIIKAKPKG